MKFDPYTEGYWSQTLAEALCDQAGSKKLEVDLNSVMETFVFWTIGKKSTY